jgi:DNA-binding GntR family transcriptional regulator
MSGAREHPRGGSAADVLAAALRSEILDGARRGGARLREQTLADAHDAARHTVRAALRQLAAEGLVRITPNAGARVASLAPQEIADLSATRTLLEVGAARRALALGDGRLPAGAHAAAERFAVLCRSPSPGWGAIVVAHARFHEALVAAAGSPRLTRAHAALSAELALFLVQGRPHFSAEALAADHLALVAALERDGPGALEAHLAASAAALLGAG